MLHRAEKYDSQNMFNILKNKNLLKFHEFVLCLFEEACDY
jgi:hypothetical protein